MNQRLVTALAERHRIERELGQGGMATVYFAEDLKHGRKVALRDMSNTDRLYAAFADRHRAERELGRQDRAIGSGRGLH